MLKEIKLKKMVSLIFIKLDTRHAILKIKPEKVKEFVCFKRYL
jgi:hypothetical protein